MIPFQLPEEKQTLLHYAELLNDQPAKQIIEQDDVYDKKQAEHLARFFWRMAHASNDEDEKAGQSSEYILEKIIITLMGYYRSAGYEDIWETVSDEQ